MKSGWFISPSNRLIEIGQQTHISFVCQNSKLFNLTKSEILTIYKEHEGIEYEGTEGKAASFILTRLSQDGWLFVRQYNNCWRIQGTNWYQVKSKLTFSKMSEIIKTFDSYADLAFLEVCAYSQGAVKFSISEI